jgi:tetratricopeptide (TPR) repeat protein
VPETSATERRAEWIDGAAVAAIALVAYLRTLAPVVTTGDSGELVTAAATLTLAHPTGYPLYLLLAHAFLRATPMLDPAHAMNLLSALFAAGAVALLRSVARELGAARAPAAAAALSFAFSASFWGEAVTARVYSLSALLFSAALLCSLRARRGDARARRLAWLWIGLGLANHSVIAILVPLALWRSARAEDPLRIRATEPLATAAGLSLYAYLPLAARGDAIQTWGDPSSWRGLVAYLTRSNYWDQAWVASARDLGRVLRSDLLGVSDEIGALGVLVLAVGVLRLARRDARALAWLLAIAVANFAVVALHGSYNDLFHWGRYRIPAWMLCCAVAALGLDLAAGPPRWRRALPFALPTLLFAQHFAAADASDRRIADRFARTLLAQLEPGALLYAGEDNTAFPVTYLWAVEGLRPDLELRWVGSGLPLPAAIDPRERPVYVAHEVDLRHSALRVVPFGLAYRVWPRAELPPAPPPSEAWRIAEIESADFEAAPFLDRSLAAHYFMQRAVGFGSQDLRAALGAAERARDLSRDDPVGLINAGLYFEEQLEFERSLACFRAAAALDPKRAIARQRTRFLERALPALAAAPSPELRALGLARALSESGRPSLALRAIERALAERPDAEPLLRERARLRSAIDSGAATVELR